MSEYQLRQFGKGRVIFGAGSQGDVAYILKEGSVEISVKVGSNKTVITTLKPPAVFGEMALLLKEHKRTATVIAAEDCELVEIKRQDFDDYIAQSPKVIASVLTALASRLRETTVRASKVPDMFMGVSEILNLFRSHTDSDFLYDRTVQSLSNAFLADKDQIQEIISMMVDVKLVELKRTEAGREVINMPQKDDFIQRARKIGKAMKGLT